MDALNSASERRGRLLRVLGVGFGLAVIIGNTIGAGIFRAPGTIAQQLPDPWLFLAVWIIGGLYALLGAISLSELGAMIPRSGGQYVFARYALGEYAGFIVGWSDWISTCGSAWGSTTQNFTSLIKALAFLALIAAAFALGRGGSFTEPATISAPGGLAIVAALVISLQAVIYTYDGWAGVIYFSEEVKNPGRDIPRAMLGGVLLVIVIYLLVNLALLYVLPISEIAGQDFAAGVAAQVIFGRYGGTIFLTLTILSMLSAINAYHLMSTRVLFAISRDGLFTKRASAVNKGGTPTVALFMSAAVAVLFIVFGQTFEKVITVLAFFFVANYALSFISVFVLRRREPDKTRPYRAWGYPWTTALALLGSIAFLIGAIASDTWNSVYALLLLTASYPVFRLSKRFTSN